MVAMMMPLVMVAVPVSPAFGLESSLDLFELCSEATEHVFNHMIGPNQKNTVSNFSRQMPIAQVPGKAHQLCRILVSDFYKLFGSSLNL